MAEQQEMSKPKFPSEIIDLPSEGKVYSIGHPLIEGKIDIKYMTAREEDILTSANLIKKGVVLDKLFESIIVDKSINIDDIIICAEHLKKNKTILRHFDLQAIVNFILYVNKKVSLKRSLQMENYFESPMDIDVICVDKVDISVHLSVFSRFSMVGEVLSGLFRLSP